jgi:aspartate/methionine/tyrosine aminotransferase
MKIETFEMERMQSTWENVVDYDLSESGVFPVTLRELVEMGFDLDWALDTPLSYSQSNGTPELKEAIARMYPGATPENIEVTNGTSEANFLVPLSRLRDGDRFALEVPNYMQLWGVPRSIGADVDKFHLRPEDGWEPDFDELERAITPATRMVYVSNPNNPTGAVLSTESMERIVERCEEVDAYLMADEVYLGAEIHRERTRSFWGMSEKVIVTSGLSKAFGIPGVRIGWIVGPEELVYDCWTQHDSYTRGRELLQENLVIISEWVEGLGEGFSLSPPDAGAMAFIKFPGDTPSVDLCKRIRKNQSTLIVPGAYLGMEGYIRIWFGARADYLRAGLGRIETELRQALQLAAAGAT